MVPLLIAAVFGATGGALLLLRRGVPLPRLTRGALLLAILLLVLAAGELHLKFPKQARIAVMVDLSSSTRTAIYRDRAALDSRLKQLLGSRAFDLYGFAEHAFVLSDAARLADVASARTVFAPPDASAVILFSDGRFELPPSAPPTYFVIDGGLIDPPDAAVAAARFEDGVADVRISGRGAERTLGVTGASPLTVWPQSGTWHRIKTPAATVMRADLSPGDVWPENDALTFTPPPPPERPRWWISRSAAPPGWVGIQPSALPTMPEEWLAPAVIALDNLPIDDLPAAAQDRLTQYVRDLGGALLIAGGDRSFGAGGYSGSGLEALSPLASDPPTPTVYWMLLTDASGSMATPIGASTRWAFASTALANVVLTLPASDLVSVGSFAADLRWWINATPVTDAKSQPIPPLDASSNGPTNLEPALRKLIEQAPVDMPKELLLLTDGETAPLPAGLANDMRAKRIRLHVLAVGAGPALPSLQAIATTTNGTYAVELNAGKWSAGVQRLMRSAAPDRLLRDAVAMHYVKPMLQSRMVSPVNRTWLKSSATLIAGGQELPLIAQWAIGNGQVLATAFSPQDAEREALANVVAQTTIDPRHKVNWSGPGKVIVNAVEKDQFLNHLPFTLDLQPLHSTAMRVPFTQTGPGQYEAVVPVSSQPRLAVVRLEGREIDRQALPGRYAPEFDAVGIDRRAAERLVERTGGRIIDATQITPIDLPRPTREISLTPWLASIAAGLIAFGLIHWKRLA